MSENSYEEDFAVEEKPSAKSKTGAAPPANQSKTSNFASPPPNSNGNLLSIEQFGIYEQQARLSSPRSLEACYEEGIDPGMLLYIDKKHFMQPGLHKDVSEMRFEFHERRRLALIDSVKEKRREIEQRRLHSHYPLSTGEAGSPPLGS